MLKNIYFPTIIPNGFKASKESTLFGSEGCLKTFEGDLEFLYQFWAACIFFQEQIRQYFFRENLNKFAWTNKF